MQSLADPQVQQSLIQRIRALSSTNSPRWGKMTANQMLCHLRDSYLTAFGEKPVSSAPGRPLRWLMKYVALYVPMQWPKNLPTRPEVQQGAGGTPPKEFSHDQESLIAVLQRFSVYGDSFQTSSHPIFGSMRKYEWLRWGYLHADHHLRQFGV